MHGHRAIAFAIFATLASPGIVGAQGRVSTGASGRVAQPGARSARPLIRAPFGTNGILPTMRSVRARRPILFRSFALGLIVLDPYWWLDPFVGDMDAGPPMAPNAGPILSGGLQLDVEPRRALVYVDGLLAGTVDEFKGYFQHLETSAGFHTISFLAADYDPLTITVAVTPNKTTTYRGFLNRSSGR